MIVHEYQFSSFFLSGQIILLIYCPPVFAFMMTVTEPATVLLMHAQRLLYNM